MGKFKKINSFLFMVLLALVLTPCPAYADNVLSQVASKSLDFLMGARGIVYVLGGFGLVMFAFMAIFGKTNWKHFSYIGIGLFLVASMGMFVDYFAGGKLYKHKSSKSNLQYGDHIKGVYADTSGTDNTIPEQDADGGGGDPLDPNKPGGGGSGSGGADGSGGGGSGGGDIEGGESTIIDPTGILGPDGKIPPIDGPKLDTGGLDLPTTLPPMAGGQTGEDGKKGGGKLSFGDIIQSGKDALNAGHEIKDAVNTGKNTIKDVIHHADDVKDAWKNANGIGGIFDAILETGSSIGQASDSVVRGGENIASNASSAAGAVSDIGKNKEQREQNDKKRDETGGANNVEEWINNQGKDAIDTANKIQDKVAGVGDDISSVGGLGAGAMDLGGDGLGGAIGAAGAIGAVVGGVVDSTKKNKDDNKTEAPKTEAPKTEAPKTEAPKTETPKPEAPAKPKELTQGEFQSKQYEMINSLGYQATGQQSDGSHVSIFRDDSGQPIVKVAKGDGFIATYNDGSTMVRYPDGATAKFDKDGKPKGTGTTSTTDKDGVTKVYNTDGTVSIKKPNGAIGVTRQDGQTEYLRKDGKTVVVDKHGYGVILDESGKEIGDGYTDDEDYL